MKLRKSMLCGLLGAVLLLWGCEEGTPAETDIPDTAVTGTHTEEGTAPDAEEGLLLLGEGAPEYIIVRGDMAEKVEVDAAVLLRQYLEKCGLETKITTDWEKNPVSEFEFVVGETLRAEKDPAIDTNFRDVGEEGFRVQVSGSRIYLAGGSPEGTYKAVEYFLSEFFGYQGVADVAHPAETVSVPKEYTYVEKQSYPITSLSADGKNLHNTRIAWDSSLKNVDMLPIAEKIQEYFYKNCGVWLEVYEQNNGTEPVGVFLSGETAGKTGSMRFSVKDGGLLIASDTMEGFSRGFKKFTEENFAKASGDVNLTKDFSYVTDLLAVVNYEEFGALGDGKTNDIAAIIAAHNYANKFGIPVKAQKGKIYYISETATGATIRTNVDWTDVSFIIDDSAIPLGMGQTAIFNVTPTKSAYDLPVTEELKTIAKGQEKLPVTLPEDSVLVLTEAGSKQYVRYGVNANEGSDKTESIVVDKDGNVDMNAPIIWDYTKTSSIRVVPMDETTITIKGGNFTTIAHPWGRTSYFTRGLRITRSNVVVDGLKHYVLGEGDTGALYSGILTISNCANVTAKNCLFTGHRYPPHPSGSGGVGSYDISPSRVVNLTFDNCRQTNDILNTTYWGVIGTNFCKNITVKDCVFSRFDAHQGVANVTILGSELGWQCLSVIGSGTFRMEDSKVYGSGLVGLRTDYGSTWEGEMIIKNCTWVPNRGNALTTSYSIITGTFRDDHDFGYECYLPHTITIENLYVDDSNATAKYAGINIFGNFNSKHKSEAYEASLADNGYPPYHLPENLYISGFRTASGKTWNLSTNPFMFRNVVIHDGDAAEIEK